MKNRKVLDYINFKKKLYKIKLLFGYDYIKNKDNFVKEKDKQTLSIIKNW